MLLFHAVTFSSLYSPLEWCYERPLRYFALEQVDLRALRSCRSPSLMWPCSFPQRDPTSYFFFENLPPWQRLVRGMWRGGGVSGIKRISTDIFILRVPLPYCTVLYRNTFLRLLRQSFAKLLISCLSISRARLSWSPHLKVTKCEDEGSGW